MTRMTLMVAVVAIPLALAGVAAAGSKPLTTGSCGAKPDTHGRWEVVFVTEKTRASAEKAATLVRSRGFRAVIEVESCSAYEVAIGGYTSSAAVQSALNAVKKAGFKSATREDS